MYSYRHFIPGGIGSDPRMIYYVSEYKLVYGYEGRIQTCYCIPNKYDKNTPGSDSASAKTSYATKIAGIIQQTKGGKSQYGNFYLGQQLKINYLGKMEGMPGGSGAPPVNRF